MITYTCTQGYSHFGNWLSNRGKNKSILREVVGILSNLLSTLVSAELRSGQKQKAKVDHKLQEKIDETLSFHSPNRVLSAPNVPGLPTFHQRYLIGTRPLGHRLGIMVARRVAASRQMYFYEI